MEDDPSDAFDTFADAIRSEQDKLEAVDELRSAKATEKRKPEPDHGPDASAEPTPPPEDD